MGYYFNREPCNNTCPDIDSLLNDIKYFCDSQISNISSLKDNISEILYVNEEYTYNKNRLKREEDINYNIENFISEFHDFKDNVNLKLENLRESNRLLREWGNEEASECNNKDDIIADKDCELSDKNNKIEELEEIISDLNDDNKALEKQISLLENFSKKVLQQI